MQTQQPDRCAVALCLPAVIEQWDGTGDECYCVGIPTKHIDAFIGALAVANKNRERALVLDCERKQVYFEDEKNEA